MLGALDNVTLHTQYRVHKMRQGFVKIAEYEQLTANPKLGELEAFSKTFYEKNREILRPYAMKWASDPLHQWSRIWEYPFATDAIKSYLSKPLDRKLRILDAGSGITFFPYFLKSRFPTLDIVCLDYDPLLQGLYEAVNRNTGVSVEFNLRSMDSSGFDSEAFDLIYCISVLEHTRNYPDIIREFKRVLRPHGELIVTFDISLDKRADIPLGDAQKLLKSLQGEFEHTDQPAIAAFEHSPLPVNEIVTTGYVKRVYPERLPWRYPRLSGVLAALRKKVLPIPVMKKLTFACFIFNKI